MKTQKPKRSKWFSLVVGGIAFMVLANSAAEARNYVADYQANPNGYVVAVNQANKTTHIMKKIQEASQRQTTYLLQKHHLNLQSVSAGGKYSLKSRIKNSASGAVLEMTLYKEGKIVDHIGTVLPSTASTGGICSTISHVAHLKCSPGQKCKMQYQKKKCIQGAIGTYCYTYGVGICTPPK